MANSLGGVDCAGQDSGIVSADTASIIEDASCSSDTRNIDPLLAPLADNGGDTQTHALLSANQTIESRARKNILADGHMAR